jgi:hypothetical protein
MRVKFKSLENGDDRFAVDEINLDIKREYIFDRIIIYRHLKDKYLNFSQCVTYNSNLRFKYVCEFFP